MLYTEEKYFIKLNLCTILRGVKQSYNYIMVDFEHDRIHKKKNN